MLIGLDIGGTKIEGVIVSPSDSKVHYRLRLPTPKSHYADFLSSVREVINELLSREENVSSIGIGCCGSINQISGLMQGANILYLNGKDFLGDIQSTYDLPIALTNDANCLAISEFKSGAASGAQQSCLAVIIGTGCGGGVIVNGSIVDGLNGLGGEIGHSPLPGYTPDIDGHTVDCYCGSKNCIESFVSGTGFERTWAEKHNPKSAPEIFAAATQGDNAAIEHVERYADQLARVLGAIVNVIDPEMIVLGGGVSNQTLLYPMVEEKLSQYTFSKQVTTPVVQAKHGDSSGVLGAAYLPMMKGML